jgi:hypothetical protein
MVNRVVRHVLRRKEIYKRWAICNNGSPNRLIRFIEFCKAAQSIDIYFRVNLLRTVLNWFYYSEVLLWMYRWFTSNLDRLVGNLFCGSIIVVSPNKINKTCVDKEPGVWPPNFTWDTFGLEFQQCHISDFGDAASSRNPGYMTLLSNSIYSVLRDNRYSNLYANIHSYFKS